MAPAPVPFVVKYGGNAMVDASVRRGVATALRGLAEAGSVPVVVHGGGPFIAEALASAGIESRFVRGLRVTTDAAMPIVERALTMLGKRLAGEIGPAVGLTGRDARLLRAKIADPELGRVGRMSHVDVGALRTLTTGGYVPVLGCVAVDDGGAALNVNADEVAGAVAGALGAPALFLTNVPGVLDDPSDPATLVATVSRAEVAERIDDGRIAGGMIPKVEAALAALAAGAPHAQIADGRSVGAVVRVLERAAAGDLGAEAIGTRIVP